MTLTSLPQSVGATTVTATFDGGAGTDTLSMDDDKAAALDGSSVFADDTNFEVLNINSTIANGATINVGTLGFGSNVILNGSTGGGTGNIAGLLRTLCHLCCWKRCRCSDLARRCDRCVDVIN